MQVPPGAQQQTDVCLTATRSSWVLPNTGTAPLPAWCPCPVPGLGEIQTLAPHPSSQHQAPGTPPLTCLAHLLPLQLIFRTHTIFTKRLRPSPLPTLVGVPETPLAPAADTTILGHLHACLTVVSGPNPLTPPATSTSSLQHLHPHGITNEVAQGGLPQDLRRRQVQGWVRQACRPPTVCTELDPLIHNPVCLLPLCSSPSPSPTCSLLSFA